MMILSADTSSSRFSVALLKDDRLMDEEVSDSGNRHSSELLPAIDKLLSRNSCSLEDIDGLSVGVGPGSFTGLRVGITTMKALAMSLGKPIVGIPSIDAIAHNLIGQNGRICPVIDARQKKIYSRIYISNGKRIKAESGFLLLGIKDLLKKIKDHTVFSGDAIALYKDDITSILGKRASFAPEALWYPRASITAKMGLERLRAGRKDNVFTLSPLYIYPKECQIKTCKP